MFVVFKKNVCFLIKIIMELVEVSIGNDNFIYNVDFRYLIVW